MSLGWVLWISPFLSIFTEKKNVQPELRTTSHDRMGKPMLLWREIINSFPSDNNLLDLLFPVSSTACCQMDLLTLHHSSTPKSSITSLLHEELYSKSLAKQRLSTWWAKPTIQPHICLPLGVLLLQLSPSACSPKLLPLLIVWCRAILLLFALSFNLTSRSTFVHQEASTIHSSFLSLTRIPSPLGPLICPKAYCSHFFFWLRKSSRSCLPYRPLDPSLTV